MCSRQPTPQGLHSSNNEPLLGSKSFTTKESAQHAAAAARQLPGFWRQFRWCMGRAMVLRTREPLAVFTDYAVFALTGRALTPNPSEYLIKVYGN